MVFLIGFMFFSLAGKYDLSQPVVCEEESQGSFC